MRAVVAHAAKDLRVEERPTQPLGPHDTRVRVGFGGICGSDLHYYNHGGFGVVRLREPMILGHEVASVVDAVGTEVGRVKVGDRIAVNPSVPCNACRYCLEGLQNQCLDMRFYGSAMRFPHVQGASREELACRESQAHAIGEGMSLQEAAERLYGARPHAFLVTIGASSFALGDQLSPPIAAALPEAAALVRRLLAAPEEVSSATCPAPRRRR